MPLVKFKTVQGGEVAVRTEDVFYAQAGLGTPADDTELWWDGPRQVIALESLKAVKAKLGAEFVDLPAASAEAGTYLVNRGKVTAVIPHPQAAGVCFVQGQVRHVTVRGGLDEILKRLAS